MSYAPKLSVNQNVALRGNEWNSLTITTGPRIQSLFIIFGETEAKPKPKTNQDQERIKKKFKSSFLAKIGM